jgi:hypothetical protein
MYSSQYNKITELSEESYTEDCDTGYVYPTGDGASSNVLADREDASKHSTDGKDEDEETTRVGLALRDDDNDDDDNDAARHARVDPDTKLYQSLLPKRSGAKALSDGTSVRSTGTIKSAKGDTPGNPITIDDDGDAEPARRTSCHSTNWVSDHSSSNGVDRSLSIPSGKQTEQKRKRAFDRKDGEMPRRGKIQCRE